MKAWPGATTQTLISNLNQIYDASVDLYIIAIGTNDIRYRNKKLCAMDSMEYVKNIDGIVSFIRSKRADTRFVFISPWPSLWYDPLSNIPEKEKIDLMHAYTNTLDAFCEKNKFLFINPADKITRVLTTQISSNYLVDFIHPNASDGIILYSRTVLDPAI
jgi:lysophospholipase L1-like esterase